MASGMKGISTHVLDLARGRPAGDVQVRLERQENSEGWLLLASAQTDQDGRCAPLLPADNLLTPGVYRLGFNTASYYISQKIDSFYPLIDITFHVREGEEHLHIPLLLSPNGYTTYRGS
jgi:5-hydroxyisourate hydrolase